MKKQLLGLLIIALSATTFFQSAYARTGPVEKAIYGLGRVIQITTGFVIVIGGVAVAFYPLTNRRYDPELKALGIVAAIPITLFGALIMEHGIEGFNKLMNKKHKPKHHHGDHERVDVVVHTK